MTRYDVVVVGAGLGGLAAAALAAKKKKRALLVESGASVGGAVAAYVKDGYRFNPGPAVTYGFERGGAFYTLGEQLGIPQQATVQSPCYQVAFPDRRITVFAEQAETLEELGREFPSEINKIRKLHQDLSKQAVRGTKSRISSFLSDHRSAAAFVRSFNFSREFRAYLEIQSRYFFRQSVSQLSLRSLIRMCDTAPSTLLSGLNGIAEQLLEVFLQNGGEVNFDVPISEIKVRQGELSLPRGTVSAGSILFNIQREQKTSIMVAVREEVMPVSMLREIIIAPDYGKPDCFFSVTVSGKDDRTAAPAGIRTMTAAFEPCAVSSFDRQMDEIRQLIPFMDSFLIMKHQEITSQFHIDMPSLKKVKSFDHLPLLKSSLKGAYLLPDGEGTPEQSVAAARAFVEKLS